MMYILGFLIAVLLVVVFVQIGKINEIVARLRGQEVADRDGDEISAKLMVVFMVLFLVGSTASAIFYKDSMLGYGPLELATPHALAIQGLINTTIFFTGIVFIVTHIALFLFAYKYRRKEGRVAKFIDDNHTLEIIWTAIPAVVMAILVTMGLYVWNNTMADVGEEEKPIAFVSTDMSEEDIKEGVGDNTYLEIEATGMQFAWILRHPGPDGLIGEKNYKMIDAENQLGQDFSDAKNIDDIILDELVLPVGQKVRVRITSRDVLHNFAIPHFFVKMDAVPGMPTYFVFTPTITTEQYRENLSSHPDWQVPADATDPDSKMRWEEFNYELACAELCGRSHYSMRKIVKVVSREEYNQWLKDNMDKSYYLNNIRGTEDDQFIEYGKLTIEEKIEEYAKEKEAAEKTEEASDTSSDEETGDADTSSTDEGEDASSTTNTGDVIDEVIEDVNNAIEGSGVTEGTGTEVPVDTINR